MTVSSDSLPVSHVGGNNPEFIWSENHQRQRISPEKILKSQIFFFNDLLEMMDLAGRLERKFSDCSFPSYPDYL